MVAPPSFSVTPPLPHENILNPLWTSAFSRRTRKKSYEIRQISLP
jgi:hypothetical protein